MQINPSPAALLSSLRGLGYSPETAIADLIDNSLSAGARLVRVHLDWNEGTPIVQVLDDGRGMSHQQLENAMRFGGVGPDVARDDGDLGRFGLGLKTASLSQARRLSVSTRCVNSAAFLEWDVDEVIQQHKWLVTTSKAPPEGPLTAGFLAQPHGTLVTWTRIDALSALWGLAREEFNARITDIRLHLAMTFHRFLDGEIRKLAIDINGRRIMPWDPFCRWHPATSPRPIDRVRTDGITATIRPFVLPHRDRFESDEEHAAAGGPGGWTERQGFYVYRGGRLVSPGGWLGLGGARAWTREESSRLARIAIDLPTSGDTLWKVDIRKSMTRPPPAARPRLTSAASDCRRRAHEVFAWRGVGRASARRARRTSDPDVLWEVAEQGRLPRYRVRRDHPVVAAMLAHPEHGSSVGGLLRLLELTVPVERIWLDVADEGGAPPPRLPDDDIPALAAALAPLFATAEPIDNPDLLLSDLLRTMKLDSPALRAAILRELGNNGCN